MIPLRVVMRGWMRYRDEQVADFAGGNLIAIVGENGAGKSSIFDAMTFALYGQHRLGRNRNTAELISQDLDRLSVEFEFESDGGRYLVRRSRGRKDSERDQGLWAWDAAADAWVQVPGSEKEDGLRRLLARIVRLTPEAFTASFLLQQGAATTFLDADPKPRFDIISSLIGLDEYRALERKARDAQRVEEQRLKDMTEKLQEFAGVDEAAVADLRAQAEESARIAARRERGLQDARALLADAERYTRLSREIAVLDASIAQAEAVLGQAEEIERDAALYEALGEKTTAVESVRDALEAASRLQRAADEAAAEAGAIDLDALKAADAAAGAAALAVAQMAADAENALADARKAERAAHDFATRAAAVLEARRRLAELDTRIDAWAQQLAALPAAEAEARALQAVREALPALRLLKEASEAVEGFTEDPAATLERLVSRREDLARETEDAGQKVKTAAEGLEEARRVGANREARAADLERQQVEREGAADEAVCSRCGQPVDRDHALAEAATLANALADARVEARAAADAVNAAGAILDQARARLQAVSDETTARDRQIAVAEAKKDDYAKARKAATQRLDEFAAVAPLALRQAMDAATGAQAIVALIAANGDAPVKAQRAASEVARLRAVEGQRASAVADREVAAATLATAESGLDGRLDDVGAAAGAHEAAATQLQGAETCHSQARDRAEAARQAAGAAGAAFAAGREQRLAREAEARQRLGEVVGHRRTAEAFASTLGDHAAASLADPSATLADLSAQRQALADAPARKATLDQAQRDHGAWAGQRSAKLAEIDQIPPPHRVDAGEAARASAEAVATAEATRAEAAASQRRLATIEARLEELRRLREDARRAQERSRLLKLLVRLLGKSGLQGALVTDALNAITSHANGFLQRLTGGSLQLHIQRAEGDSLELQAIDATCMREPRSARALSGSQKFRCAVAIAAGIGQYVGAGGMRSIVIDEGFGSLDRSGQQLMVEELKNLASHMDKVIVVSHLEAFTDRDSFPDQVVVEAVGSSSRISRAF